MALTTLSGSGEKAAAEAKFSRRVELVMASVDLHHTCLLNYLRSFANHHDAEDILQELWKFVVVHFAEDQIDCLPLLRRKAYQLFIDHYRRCVARGKLMEKAAQEPLREKQEFVYDEADEPRLQAKFWEEFPVDLTVEQKNVLWHYARYGLTFQEIESRLGVKASTACDWVKLGREKLAPFLNDH
jgi:DNA-directed RNA polymerase specialized sigma24 family protein